MYVVSQSVNTNAFRGTDCIIQYNHRLNTIEYLEYIIYEYNPPPKSSCTALSLKLVSGRWSGLKLGGLSWPLAGTETHKPETKRKNYKSHKKNILVVRPQKNLFYFKMFMKRQNNKILVLYWNRKKICKWIQYLM